MRLANRFAPSLGPSVAGAVQNLRTRQWVSLPHRGTLTALAPLITAVIALAALAAFPWTVRSKLATIRLEMAETVAPARELVRDIEAASALELVAERDAAASGVPERARHSDAAIAIMRTHDAALATLAPRLEHRVARDLALFRGTTARWLAAGESGSTVRDGRLGDLIAAAARLDSSLARRQSAQRARIESLEALDTLLPSILTPILAAAMFAIYWTGRRIAASAKAAEQSRLALAAAHEERVTLLRGLTHDLKNALGAARGYTLLLMEEISGPLSTKQRDQLGRIGRILGQTITAVEDALLVARTEAGTLPVRRRLEDLRALALDSAADYVAEAERAELTLTVEFSEELPLVDTDGSLVSKIVGNLLSNAIKYTPSRGRIWLRASRKARTPDVEARAWIAVEVCDTGPGIPATLRERVFDEFFRAPAATATARGEGIGLAMSRRVARLLNGDITLRAGEGGGASFTLWLPTASPDADRIANTVSGTSVSAPPARPSHEVPATARATHVYDRRAAAH